MTKTFCIGLFKTGTTSYSRAMSLLGLRDLHFPQRYVAALAETRSPFLWSRVPFDSMSNVHETEWPELPALYPDCRFVLTTRDIEQWLPSVQQHMSHAWPDALRAVFDDRFDRVFGVPCRADAFDEALFRRKFSGHDEHVRDACPRLLVLNLDSSGDDKLQALSVHVAQPVQYPHANKRRQQPTPGAPLMLVGGRRYEGQVA